MQAITTKVLGPTDTKGTRIKANTASGVSVTLSWDYDCDELDNARRAVRELVRTKLNDGWHGRYLATATADGYVFCRDDNPPTVVGADDYESRVQAYERQGMTRSDAQGVVDAEDM